MEVEESEIFSDYTYTCPPETSITSTRQPSGSRGQRSIFPFFLERANPKCVYVSVRVLQCGKSIHKIVHNISLGQILPTTMTTSSAHPTFLLQQTQGRTSLHGYERSTERLKPRCDLPQRLALPPLLLLLPRAEMGLMAFGLCCDRCAPVGLDVEYVRFEGEWVDELEGKKGKKNKESVSSGFAIEMKNELTYAFMFSGRGWMSGGSSTWGKKTQ
jgi:hypothetical protein